MEYLFSEQAAQLVLQNHLEKLRHEIGKLSKETLTQNDNAKLEAHYTAKYVLDVPELLEDSVEGEESKVELIAEYGRNDPYRLWQPTADEYKGLLVHVPFTGDHEFFKVRPSTFDIVGYQAVEIEIKDHELQLKYLLSDQTKEHLAADLVKINQHLATLRLNVQPYRDQLLPTMQQAIAQRRRELHADNDLMQSIGIKIRERPGVAKTYVVPEIRKKIIPALATGHGPQEPTLDLDTYNEIIKACKDMALVMERSPSAFVGMGEEHLRDHFLVPLNNIFGGDATGETFNAAGKTDILIRHKGQNLFIGECKIWDGGSTLNAAIKQILDYTTWRDTKTAIIMFNRNKDFTAVVKKAGETMKEHANFKGPLYTKDEGTDSRFTFRHKNDPDREVMITLLLFDVPTS
jgi:hypothetical protein